MKQYHYKITSYGPDDEDLAEVWWDSEEEKIVCTNKIYYNTLRKLIPNGYKYKDGLDFMKNLPYAYKNGYTGIKRVTEDEVE